MSNQYWWISETPKKINGNHSRRRKEGRLVGEGAPGDLVREEIENCSTSLAARTFGDHFKPKVQGQNLSIFVKRKGNGGVGATVSEVVFEKMGQTIFCLGP